VFVAETDGTVAGTYALIILDNLAKRGARAGVVEDVAVLPVFQGRGIGRAMMEHAREECHSAGCYKMTLSSNVAREGAHRFYDALGFERHGYSFLMHI
jgi:GNAT superfamily N-acetyltransferase